MELITRGNPSVYSLMLVATSPFRGDILNFYMLPERELAKSRQ